MDPALDPAELYTSMLIFVRAGALSMLVPAFSAQGIPVVVRIALVFALSWAVAGFVPSGSMPPGFVGVSADMAHEAGVGLSMGLAVRLVLYTIEIAGQIMATEVGLMVTSSLDPTSHGQSSPITEAFSYLALVVFFATGSHHLVLEAFVRSFELVPPSVGHFGSRAIEEAVEAGGRMFLLAVQIAAPLVAINFVVNICLALLNRAAPTINAFLLSLPLQILAGLVMLGMVVSLAAYYMLGALDDVPELMLRFVH